MSDAEASKLKREIGLDLTNYIHSVDESAMRHIRDRHGPGNESKPDQLPVIPEDIFGIPQIIESYDSVRSDGKNDRGLDVIRYEKRINGIIYCLEEVRTGRRKLTTMMMYKKRAGSGSPQQSLPTLRPSRTQPEAGRLDATVKAASATGSTDIIGALGPEVKAKPDEMADFARRCRDAAARIRPLRVGSRGQLLEWDKEFVECDAHHRHVSHLVGLYPGDSIMPERTPDLFDAARTSLQIRGDSGTGWSMAWKVGLWARLRDGDHALVILGNFFKLIDSAVNVSYAAGGIYTNLFCAHPPFQIDGNFGVTAGIAEMLLQSHAGEIHLLPALPAAWPTGRVRGLCARGGAELDIEWQGGNLVAATARSRTDTTIILRYRDRRAVVDSTRTSPLTWPGC